MKTKFLKYILLFIIISCNSLTKENFNVAEEIITTINAESGELFFRKNLSEINPKKEYFIQLVVNNSELIEKKKTNSKLVASHCAIELYKNIDLKTIEKNYGFEIKIQGSIKESFFFEKEKIKKALSGINTIDRYIKLVKEGEFEKANLILDIEDDIEFDYKTTERINKTLNNTKNKAYHFFSENKYKDENDSWIFVSYINLENDNQIIIKTLINKSNSSKISYIEFE